MELTLVKMEGLRPAQPRQHIDQSKKAALMESLREVGLQIPVILYEAPEGLTIVDGHLRIDCLIQLGEKDVDAIVLKHPPTDAELLLIQLSIDLHRQSLTHFERADLLKGSMQSLKGGVTELAKKTGMTQPVVSKLLPLASLSPAIREILQGVDQEKCYMVARESDAAKQLELARNAAGFTREQMRRRVRGVELNATTVRLPLPSGITVIVRGKQMTLKDLIQAIGDVAKELKQAARDRLDVSTCCKVFADKAKATS